MKKNTKILALIIWLIGAIILLGKSNQLLIEAHKLSATFTWPLISVIVGLILGIIKTKLVFIPFCKHNLMRIDSIEKPQIWNAFTFKFWIMLMLMMALGAILSKIAPGNLIILSIVSAIDLMVGTGLLLSSKVFFSGKTLF